MKGDIKISKKTALLLVGALSVFAAADFVSMIDVKNTGGIVVDGPSEDEITDLIKEEILNSMPIGSLTLRMDAVNPSTIYGGSWTLITGDAALSFGNGSVQSGTSYGSNTPAVPLIAHTHTINHNHPVVTTNTDSHAHTQYVGQTGSGSPGRHGWNMTGTFYNQSSFGSTSSDSHNHTVDLPNFTGNSGSAGVSNATMNVRGSRIDVNVWKRIG